MIAEGNEAIERVRQAERRLIAAQVEMSAYTKKNRALEAENEQLRKDNDRLVAEVNIYRLSTNNDRQSIGLLKQNNTILEHRDNKQFNLSFGLGYGIAGNKTSFGPSYFVGFTAGWTLLKL